MEGAQWRGALLERYHIEPKCAELKRFHGLHRARYRGLLKVRIQAYLPALVVNLKRMVKLSFGSLYSAAPKAAVACVVN